ncbi:Hypothetical protein SSCIU_00845 [Mammaliicoccus sciuri]|nr:Hypothetical protein SSCIU_00845 [Mammaliicoccus sciuri]
MRILWWKFLKMLKAQRDG